MEAFLKYAAYSFASFLTFLSIIRLSFVYESRFLVNSLRAKSFVSLLEFPTTVKLRCYSSTLGTIEFREISPPPLNKDVSSFDDVNRLCLAVVANEWPTE